MQSGSSRTAEHLNIVLFYSYVLLSAGVPRSILRDLYTKIIYIFYLEDVKDCRNSSIKYYLLLWKIQAQPIF